MNRSKKVQIRNLLGVVFTGIVLACLFSAILLYKYSPSGQYEIKNVMLAPEILSSLNFNEKNSRFIFDKLEFEINKTKVPVAIDQYSVFYSQIQSDKSLEVVTDEIRNAFNKPQVAKLKVLIKTESSTSQAATKSFQEIEFSPQGNYYRVQLRESNAGLNEAYFYHPGIYQTVLNNFSLGEGL